MQFFVAEALPVPAPLEQSDEVLVADTRAGLTPSDMVERKLIYLLHGASVAASHVRRPHGRLRNEETVAGLFSPGSEP